MVIFVLDELLLLPRRFFLLLPRPVLLGNIGAVLSEDVVLQLLTEGIGFFFKLLKESRRADVVVNEVEIDVVVVVPWLLGLEAAGSGITG